MTFVPKQAPLNVNYYLRDYINEKLYMEYTLNGEFMLYNMVRGVDVGILLQKLLEQSKPSETYSSMQTGLS